MNKEIKIFNKNIKFTTFMIFVIVLGVVFGTFALVIANPKILGINATAGDIKVNISYDGGSSSISSSGTMSPISDSEVTGPSVTDDRVLVVKFSVSGSITNPSESIYDVVLRDLDLPCEFKSLDVKWRLYKNNALLSSGTFAPSFDVLENNRMVLTNTQQDLTTSSDSYVFLMWISEVCTGDVTTCSSGNSQNKYLGKTFTGNIRIETATKSKKALTRTVANIGDLNNDGKLNPIDIGTITGYINGILSLTKQQMYSADINGDGTIDKFDVDLAYKIFNDSSLGNLPYEYACYTALYGDINEDRIITEDDLTLLRNHVYLGSSHVELTGQPLKNADINGDGSVDIFDYHLLNLYLNGEINGDLPMKTISEYKVVDISYINKVYFGYTPVGSTFTTGDKISGTTSAKTFDSITCSVGPTPTTNVTTVDGIDTVEVIFDNLTSNASCEVTFK